MFPKINPKHTKSWKQLEQHAGEMRNVRISELVANDPDRFKKYSFRLHDILVDFSKNLVNDDTKKYLIALAEECGLKTAIASMFAGDFINETEQRSVLHVALRNFSGKKFFSAGENVVPEVEHVRGQMKKFSDAVHTGEWKGYTGKKIRYIVNIGIGGSDLGPYMVTEALKPYWADGIECRCLPYRRSF
jgi:glucose-6-phosphate isomerase